MPKEIRIEMKLRNNLILSLMEAKGIKTVAELCRLMGSKDQARVGAIINLKDSPFKDNPKNEADKWKPIVHRLVEVLGVLDPEDLFPEAIQAIQIPPSTKLFAEINPQELRRLTGSQSSPLLLVGEPTEPDKALEKKEVLAAIERGLKTLTPREEKVIRYLFGLDDGVERNRKEVGVLMAMPVNRIFQIERKALRKLRHPTRSRPIIHAGGWEAVRS